ncbi:sugar-binding protein [Bifidobacterium actinocoloniiforme DSM 22766]|nr:sugar-binding protein [Bifidobacterium actinocoloniiforme DSM 22766]
MAGCGNPASSADDTDTSASGYWPAAQQKLGGVTLKFWTSPQANKIPAQVIKDFEKATGAKVDLITIPEVYENNAQTKITTGDVPDLGFWQPTRSMLAGFVAQGKLQKLDNAPFEKNYKPGIDDQAGLYNKTRYAVMVSAPSTMGVYYNKDVFKSAGVDETPQNWNEFVQTAEHIKDADVPGVQSPLFEMGGSQWGTQWAVQVQLAEAAKAGLWDRVNSGKEKFTDKTIMEAITNYQDLFKKGLYNADAGSAKDTAQEQALWDGKTSMIFGNTSQFMAVAALAGNDKAQLDQKIGYFPISKDGNYTTTIPDGSNGVVAFKTGDSKREAAARQFINFWMSDGYEAFIKQQNNISVFKNVESPSTVPQAALDASKSIQHSVGSMQLQALANPDLYVNLASMVNGTMTPQQVAQTTQDQFAQVAKAQGAKGF